MVEQLTNEIAKKKFVKGRLIREWQPRKEGVRTEGLDCRVYAYAALRGLIRNYRLDLDYSANLLNEASLRVEKTPSVLSVESENKKITPQTVKTVRRVRSKGIE